MRHFLTYYYVLAYLSRLKRNHKYNVCSFFVMDLMCSYVCTYFIIFNYKLPFLLLIKYAIDTLYNINLTK